MAPKSKTAANGTKKSKAPSATNDAPAANGNGIAAPTTPTTVEVSTEFTFVVYATGRPDKAVYDQEQEQLKAQIDALQVKVVAVKEKINAISKNGAGNERRSVLLEELNSIRGQQSTTKLARSKIFEQLQALQESTQQKIRALNAAKTKAPFRSIGELDDRVKQLDQQVESGNMKLVDEKRALAEISQLKRSRRIIEGFQAEQEAIDAERAKADELRKELDDPEAKAASERFEKIKAELDEIKKEGDELYANRNKLYDERSALQAQLDVLFNHKRESAQRFRDANDKYWSKVNEDRARRAERQRAQRAADEEAKKLELAEKIREEAEVPAFQAQIEDCQTLIDYLSGKNSAPTLSTTPAEKADLAGVPKLELRKVDAAPEGLVAHKKKSKDDDAYFVAAPRKGQKGKRSGAKATQSESTGTDASGSQSLHVPLPTLSALLSLSISPPTSSADVLRAIEDLKAKKAWFVANQARVTAENKEKAEARIRQLTGKSDKNEALAATEELILPNGGGERPPEPAPTPAITDVPSIAVPSEVVDEKLESVQENGKENGVAE